MAEQSDFILERARAAMTARDFTYAEKLLGSILKTEDNDTAALELLGSVYMRSDRLDEAMNVYRRLARVDSSNIDALNNLGVIYRRIGKYKESIQVLSLARKTDRDIETVLYNLGNTYKQMGDYSQAARCFQEVIDVKPDDVLAYNHLGSIHALSEKHDLALQAYRRGLQIDPNHPFLHYNMAHSYEALNRPTEAVNEYTAALKTKPGWLDALRDMAAVYVRTGNDPAAQATLRRALAVDKQDVRSLLELGHIAVRSNRSDDALAFYRRAIASDPTHIPAVLSLEQLFEKQGNYESALNELKSLQKRHAGNSEVEIALARLHVKLQQYAEAKSLFKRIRERDGESIAALRIEGRMYAQMGEPTRAAACFSRIIQIDPAEIGFRIDLADQMIQDRNYAAAEEQLLAYLHERPRDIAVRISLGQLYESMNRSDKALQEYKKVLREDSENVEALSAISLLYQRSGRNEDAIRLADEIVNMQGGRGNQEDLESLSDSLELYEQAVRQFGSANPAALNKNLNLLKSRKDGIDEQNSIQSQPSPAGFVPIDEDTESMALLEQDEEIISEDELPFDELVTQDEDIPDREEEIEDLVGFESPFDGLADDGQGYGGGQSGGPGRKWPQLAEEEEELSDDIASPSAWDINDDDVINLSEEAENPEDFVRSFKSEPEQDNSGFARSNSDGLWQPQTEEEEYLPSLGQSQASHQPPLGKNPQLPPAQANHSAQANQPSEAEFAPQPQPQPQSQLPPQPQPQPQAQLAPQPQAQFSPQWPSWPAVPFQNAPMQADSSQNAGKTRPHFDSSIMEDIELSQPEKEVFEIDFGREQDEELQLTAAGAAAGAEAAADAASADAEAGAAAAAGAEAASEATSATTDAADRVLAGRQVSRLLPPGRFEEMLVAIPVPDLLALFVFLKKLSLDLPDEVLGTFLLSDERIMMEYVIDRLSGKPGLSRDSRYGMIQNGFKQRITAGRSEVERTLEQLKLMAASLPDQGFAVSFHNRLEHILERIAVLEEDSNELADE